MRRGPARDFAGAGPRQVRPARRETRQRHAAGRRHADLWPNGRPLRRDARSRLAQPQASASVGDDVDRPRRLDQEHASRSGGHAGHPRRAEAAVGQDARDCVTPSRAHRSGDRRRWALNHIPADRANPARWRGRLDKLLSKPKKLSRGHHKAPTPTRLSSFNGCGRCRQATPPPWRWSSSS